MLTYQDLLAVSQTDTSKIDFCRSAIAQHKSSDMYRTAVSAENYDRQRNETILAYKKLLYTLSGRTEEDTYSANYKLCSNFYHRFTTQENQYLLGNGVTFGEADTKDKLGDDFDQRMLELGKDALDGGVAFGFWNFDHLEVFALKEFVPLYDEENSALMAGIRFWQIDDAKPLRATLYETDGYTEYIWRKGEGAVLAPKRSYKLKLKSTPIDGTVIYDGENYPTFPIVPMYGNTMHQSELVGLQSNIDAYDLIKSGYANTIDDASEIYWIVQNAGGMDDTDLAKFLNQLKRVHASVVDSDGAQAEAHTLEIPYEARDAILTRLRDDMYEDYMALDIVKIAAGATTATQIKAAYEPMNSKADEYESCVTDFIMSILTLAGIDDVPTYTRSTIVNTQEMVEVLIEAAQYLPADYVLRKIVTALGDGDQADDLVEEMHIDDSDRLAAAVTSQSTNTATTTQTAPVDAPTASDTDDNA